MFSFYFDFSYFVFRNVFKVRFAYCFMLEGLITVAWASVYNGGTIGNLLYQWEQMGMFAYVLPFLLIFAVVFGILNRTKIFDAQGVNVIISLVVGLMALQFQMVSVFFAEIFPRLGIGLSIILVMLILLGMFMPTNKDWIKYVLLAVAAVITIVIVSKSFSFVGWTTGTWWSNNWASIITIAVVLGILGVVVGGTGKGAGGVGGPKNDTETVLGNILKKAAAQ